MIPPMTDTHLLTFHRAADESPRSFATRLGDLGRAVAADDAATTVVVFVDDGEVGAPDTATAFPGSFDGALLVEGLPADALPEGDAVLAIQRRVIKARERGRDGARSPGFTILCPSVRAPQLTHEEFDAHWRDNHSKIHVASSPGTCHYEHLTIERVVHGDVPPWDGVGLLSFASADDYTNRLFDGAEGERAIYEDIPKFLDLERGETVPTSELVFRDRA